MPPTQRHTCTLTYTHRDIILGFHAMKTEWVNMGTIVSSSSRGKRMRIQWQQAGLSLQAIMQIFTHAAPLSHQHPPVPQLIHPLRIFKKLLQISKPRFSNRSNLCSMIKGREAELVAEDWITVSANDQWAQEITLWSAKAAVFIWLSLGLWLTGLCLAEAKKKQRLPWPLTLPTEYVPQFTPNTKNKLCKNKHKGYLIKSIQKPELKFLKPSNAIITLKMLYDPLWGYLEITGPFIMKIKIFYLTKFFFFMF